MRTIKAKDIRLGMTIEWRSFGLTKRAVVKGASFVPRAREVSIEVGEGFVHYLDYVCDVLVVDEPKNNQPPEPTSFGACVTVNYLYFVRYMIGHSGPSWSGDDNSVADWAELCSMGQVKVVNEDPFSELEQ